MSYNLSELLYHKFEHSSRKELSPHHGVITACDANFFAGFQMLYYSLLLNTGVEITLFDFGLTAAQIQWCSDKPCLKLVKWEEIEHSLLIQQVDCKDWHTWNKPILFSKSEYRYTLWIDSDCIAFHNIHEIFDEIKNKPVITKDTNDWHKDPNITHVLLGTNLVPHQSPPPLINAGVIGFDLQRELDQRIIKKWTNSVLTASENDKIRKGIPWSDQGCLQWVLESENVLDLVSDKREWNELQYSNVDRSSMMKFLGSLDLSKGRLIHLVTHVKTTNNQLMWRNWGETPIDVNTSNFDAYRNEDEERAKNIKFFLLGNGEPEQSLIHQRPYMEVVNFNEIELKPEWQSSQLAEHKIYLSDKLDGIDSGYVGILTTAYNSSQHQMPCLNDITALEAQLEPDTVLASEVVKSDWANQSEYWFRGMMPLLEELSLASGLDLNQGPTFLTNNFICHASVMNRFLKFWRTQFNRHFDEHGLSFTFRLDKPHVITQHGPAFFDRFAAIYFSNQKDLKIIPITNRMVVKITTPTSDKLPFVICDYHHNIEAKFQTEKEAWNYIKNHNYSARLKEVVSLEEAW